MWKTSECGEFFLKLIFVMLKFILAMKNGVPFCSFGFILSDNILLNKIFNNNKIKYLLLCGSHQSHFEVSPSMESNYWKYCTC